MNETVQPRMFLGALLKVFLKNERVLDGILTVIDPFGNLLLGDVTETTNDVVDGELHRRKIGLVSIKRSSVARVMMTNNDFRKLEFNRAV